MRGLSVPQRFFWALAAATVAVFGTLVLWIAPKISAEAGEQLIFDERLSYTNADAVKFFDALTPKGAALYLDEFRMLDTAFPALLALTLCVAIGHLTQDWRRFPRQIALTPPLLGAAFDMMENSAVATMLRAGADGLTPAMVSSASAWTTVKWLADVAAGATVAALVLSSALTRLRKPGTYR